MVRFVVFDLDGTLVDSRRDLANAANALVTELGGVAIAEDDVAMMVGEGAAVLVRRVLTAAGLNPTTAGALPRFLELYDDRLLENTAPYDGIETALTQLHSRLPLAVLTNKPQRATDRLLAPLRLAPYFAVVIGGDTPLGRKPDPTALLRLCDQVGVPPADTVLVGDSLIDLHTARNAGTEILLVRYGFGFPSGAEEIRGAPTVDTPQDIPTALGL